MRNLFLLFLSLFLFSCDTPNQQAAIDALQKDLAEAKAQLAASNKDNNARPGLVHNVFFWLKEDLSDADEAAFLAGAKSLAEIKTVKEFIIGPPAATEERDVIDNSYSYALLLDFENIEGQNAYQVDPMHLKFVEDHKDKWTKVVVYDNLLID